jgi:hypothetical protein
MMVNNFGMKVNKKKAKTRHGIRIGTDRFKDKDRNRDKTGTRT